MSSVYYGSQITDSMICAAGNYNEGTCIVSILGGNKIRNMWFYVVWKGDTGGPLIITGGRNSLLIGVASFISGNGCESTDPSGYTRIYQYADWIHNITGRYGY